VVLPVPTRDGVIRLFSPSDRPELLVIGSPSVDILHFHGRTERAAGGAGLYTSLAARRAGARVTMIAPRPDPMPPELVDPAARLDWRGPIVEPDTLPHFEIEHGPGGRTTYLNAVWGSEALLTPEVLPADLTPGLAYIVPMIESGHQLALARHLRAVAGWTIACGTYGGATRRFRDTVLATLEAADVFFCNEPEAMALFGALEDARVPAGRILFITRGARGARVVQGDHGTDIDPFPVEELDPTGAGDTFCGTALAGLAAGLHPVVCARRAAAAAAHMVTGVGPERLLEVGGGREAARPGEPEAGHAPAPGASRPAARVRIDHDRLAAVARTLAASGEVTPFPFTGEDFPEVGDPRALDFFFAATLQQFGFWRERGSRYEEPMIAPLGGRARKGSDFLWAAYRRWLAEAPEELRPERQAGLTPEMLDHRLRDDEGRNPLPAAPLHAALAVTCGRDMLALGWTPTALLEAAARAERPLATFLSALDHVGGYKEDPLRKKSALLAAILAQRPERFLVPGPGEDIPPIVDYHCQRTCLRLGIVHIEDTELEARVVDRQVLREPEERLIRAACHGAMAELRERSGRPMGAVDWFFFQMRRRCPEMREPECPACPADDVCAHRTRLFQPVFRTTAY